MAPGCELCSWFWAGLPIGCDSNPTETGQSWLEAQWHPGHPVLPPALCPSPSLSPTLQARCPQWSLRWPPQLIPSPHQRVTLGHTPIPERWKVLSGSLGLYLPLSARDKASQQHGGRKGQLTLRRGTDVPSGENECKADRNHRGGPLVNISLFPPCSFHGILRLAQETLSGNPSWKHLSERLLTLPPCSFLSQELPGCQGNLPGLPTQPCGPWDSKALAPS